MQTQKTLLVVYHSLTGGTRQMAHALIKGAKDSDTEGKILTQLKLASETSADDVLAADAYVFATPENLGAVSGLMKDFFDRCYYPALEKITGRAYATMICAGSDGHNAARQIDRITTGWRLRAVADPLIVCTHAQTAEEILHPKTISTEDLLRCETLGSLMANGLALGVF
ncbi:MAG: NAD(P)H-dependent oxidoreductase [Rugosibacter sp.]|jgi:multimeric flavodoxin WrbA|nr:NAD(P)H-dependent oxidoreductase [Rugosibacter sp.]